MAKVKVPTLKKPKSLKGLPGLGKKEKLQPLPDLDDGPQWVASTIDDEVARLTNALGSERLAKKLLKLKEKFPTGTFLELLIMEWLDRKQVVYAYQQWFMGGRKLKGGIVSDFVIDNGPTAIVWGAHGNYWHTRGGSEERDAAQKLTLLGLSWRGKKITTVVAIWESRVFTPNKAKREQAFQLGLLGVELGK